MTELEYEKVCRRPVTPVADEFVGEYKSHNVVYTLRDEGIGCHGGHYGSDVDDLSVSYNRANTVNVIND